MKRGEKSRSFMMDVMNVLSLLTESVSATVTVEAVSKDSAQLSEFGMKYVQGFRGSDVVSDAAGNSPKGGEDGDGDGDEMERILGMRGATGGIGKRRMGGEITCRNVVRKYPGKRAVRKGQRGRVRHVQLAWSDVCSDSQLGFGLMNRLSNTE